MLIIERLIELRTRNNLTQEDVANLLKVSRTAYSNYEKGIREMSYESLVKLADFYKVSLDYLFSRTDIPIHLESYSDDEIEFMIRTLTLYKEMKSKLGL